MSPEARMCGGALGNAIMAAMYHQEDDEPNLFVTALYLMRSLARNHCFLDGNKRIAWLSFLAVLATDRLTVDLPEEIAASLVHLLAVGLLDVDLLSNILGPLLVPIVPVP